MKRGSCVPAISRSSVSSCSHHTTTQDQISFPPPASCLFLLLSRTRLEPVLLCELVLHAGAERLHARHLGLMAARQLDRRQLLALLQQPTLPLVLPAQHKAIRGEWLVQRAYHSLPASIPPWPALMLPSSCGPSPVPLVLLQPLERAPQRQESLATALGLVVQPQRDQALDALVERADTTQSPPQRH